jgi:RsiW-degrading membrane proteinase PrsW (M82 family)
MNLLNIRTWDDARNFIHVALPGLAVVLVGTGWVDNTIATAVVGVGVALFSPLLAPVNTVDGFRKFLYPVLGAVASLLIVLGYLNETDWTAWLAVITILLGAGTATANTPVSNQFQ